MTNACYKAGSEVGQPIGSGAIESTCSQYQRRFKMSKQFWSLEGDEAFLALSTLQRNGWWGRLFSSSHVSWSWHAPLRKPLNAIGIVWEAGRPFTGSWLVMNAL